MADDDEFIVAAKAVFNRLLKARDRGTGIRLSADEVQTLSITSLGQSLAASDEAE